MFKRAVQHWSYDTDARTNLRPDGSEIGVRKQASLRIVELPAPDNSAGVHDALVEVERMQHAHAIGMD